MPLAELFSGISEKWDMDPFLSLQSGTISKTSMQITAAQGGKWWGGKSGQLLTQCGSDYLTAILCPELCARKFHSLYKDSPFPLWPPLPAFPQGITDQPLGVEFIILGTWLLGGLPLCCHSLLPHIHYSCKFMYLINSLDCLLLLANIYWIS